MRWLRDVAGRAITQAVVGLLVTGCVAAWAIARGDARSWASRVPVPVWTALAGAAAVVLLLVGWRAVRPRRWAPTGPAVRVTRYPYSVGGWQSFAILYEEVPGPPPWFRRLLLAATWPCRGSGRRNPALPSVPDGARGAAPTSAPRMHLGLRRPRLLVHPAEPRELR